jgi:uncharacterized membrane protein YjgN (DUF898 family)
MNRFKFEGKGFDFFKIFFVDVILALVSLSLLYPRAAVREARYFWSQTSLGGSSFEFRGTTKVAFNAFMKTLLVFVLVIIISIAEGMLIVFAKLQNTMESSYLFTFTILAVVYLLTPFILHGDLHFFINNTTWRSIKASYTGKLSDVAGITLRGNILSVLTLGIYSAWYETQLYKYILENLRFGSLRFSYDGSSKELFKIYLKGFLLGIVTLGIYHIWNFRDLYNYSVDHTLVRKGDQEFNLHSDANTRDVFELIVGNVLLVALTLGLGSAWAIIRTNRFMINHCVVPSAFNLDSIEDNELDEVTEEPSQHWLDKWNPMLLA